MREQQINEARALAPKVALNLTAADTTPAIVVQYVPNLGSGGAEAKVKVTTNGMYFEVDSSAATEDCGADAVGNTTGWLLFATYTNLGQLVDAINGHAAWRAYLAAALRTDNTSWMLATALTSVTGGSESTGHGKTFYFDNSASGHSSVVFSGEKFLNSGVNGHVTDDGDQCENTLYYGAFDCNNDVYLRFYSSSHTADTKLLADISHTASSATYINKHTAEVEFISSKRGERLVVRCAAITAAKAATPVTFQTLGKTAVLRNNRIVDEACY